MGGMVGRNGRDHSPPYFPALKRAMRGQNLGQKSRDHLLTLSSIRGAGTAGAEWWALADPAAPAADACSFACSLARLLQRFAGKVLASLRACVLACLRGMRLRLLMACSRSRLLVRLPGRACI